jgi:hypothetical protein
MAAVVLGVGRLGTRRRVKEGSSECGAERWRRGCFIGPGWRWGEGEAAGGDGVLLLIGFKGVKGGREDGMTQIQWGK